MARILIGTSGWHYRHWIGPFYPEGTSGDEMLAHYCTRFDAVEVNNTFYALPSVETVATWREIVGAQFVFACKASRYITHRKRLRDPGETLPRFLEAVSGLNPKLGPVLLQLPPRWRMNLERLSDFFEALPEELRYAFEFRDRSWHDARVYELLSKHRAAFCIYDFDRFLSPLPLTADFAYVRLHGPDGPYQGSYRESTLTQWAERLEKWRGEGRDAFCFFDNDQDGFAALNALRLRNLLGQVPADPQARAAFDHD
jgi:uncharacterized protein YecE (DUF72 family)